MSRKELELFAGSLTGCTLDPGCEKQGSLYMLTDVVIQISRWTGELAHSNLSEHSSENSRQRSKEVKLQC